VKINQATDALGPSASASAVSRHAMAVLSVGVSFLLAQGMQHYWHLPPPFALFLFAIMYSGWFGGFRPALLAVALSVLVYDYYFLDQPLRETRLSVPKSIDVPRLVLLPIIALMVGVISAAQRSAAELIRKARDDLSAKVQELNRINESLNAENAERRLAERALQRSETYLAEAQRLSYTGSFGWKISTGEILWSEETFRIFQYDRTTKPTVKHVLQRVHPEDAVFVEQMIERAMQDGKGFDFEHRLLMPDGSVKHLRIVANSSSGGPGELEFAGAVMDITARERARIALESAYAAIKKSEVQFRTILDSIPVQAWCALPDGSAEFQSRPWLEYTGLPAEKARGWGWQDAIHPDDAEQYVKRWLEIKESQAPGEAEARFRRFDGQYRWFLIRAAPLHDERGNILRWYGTSIDIDDRKRAQHALHNAEAALAHITRITTMGELTASIAHEVNQPLGAVINNANACLSLLTNGAAHLEEVREALTEIIEGADRASAVVARVRQLSRKVPFEKTLLNLRDVVTDVLTLARYEATTRRVNIHIDLPEEQLLFVIGDRVQLQQVLLNLIVNGMEAMNTIEESKRVVKIRGRSETRDGIPEAWISVQDAGSGLEPEEMDRLFEAFYTTKPQGMGMGLAISRSIIEAHGGRLWAEFNPGPGATFIFSLPAAPSPAL
jgi:PAS domain S-box-containing protein